MTSVKDYKLYVLQSSSKKETGNGKEKEKQKEDEMAMEVLISQL